MGTYCGTCGAGIAIATNERGRRVMVDARPRPDGNVELVALDGGGLLARHLTSQREAELERAILAANRAGEVLPLNLYVWHRCLRPRGARPLSVAGAW